MEIIFFVMFFAVFGIILYNLFRGIGQWNKNNHSPRLTVSAVIVAKRTQVFHHHHNTGTSQSTSYYLTFEVESGDRMELGVGRQDYGLLAEGDRGKLHFQGTRYLGFDREV